MAKLNNTRMFAQLEGDFVIFLIGMRINSFYKINKWLPVAMAMPKMLKELFTNKDSGFLGGHAWFGRTIIMLQYWRSFEHLEAYAKNKTGQHYPAWKEFNLKIRKSKAAGVWHESYKVTKGTYENIYVNMPSFGLGKAGKLIPISEKYEYAKQRLSQTN